MQPSHPYYEMGRLPIVDKRKEFLTRLNTSIILQKRGVDYALHYFSCRGKFPRAIAPRKQLKNSTIVVKRRGTSPHLSPTVQLALNYSR
jgi:hypothetical protein